ncbi:hypothetical protein BOTBODRAFT_176901 [Botryobasidium botryosum FD-172 SS1]|uniref:F-box domain-containing protein n=1 Tax=Botryobasidium botryosum (strain FD-172 SS1) TaxID=930990 RepID=A0A067MJ73_BOTB1|nr:hypothetical protein BOTBODRAFT_176901 [Botryobasidium botryosum FD-172 SS1]
MHNPTLPEKLSLIIQLCDPDQLTLCMLDTRSLVALALTCKHLYRLISPFYTHRHIYITNDTTTAHMKAFFHSASTNRSAMVHTRSFLLKTSGRRVGFLEEDSFLGSIARVFDLMPNARFIALHDMRRLVHPYPQVLSALLKFPRLQELELSRFAHVDLAALVNLRGLRSASFHKPLYTQFSPFPLHVSNVKRILLASRSTLEEISLGDLDLSFNLISSQAADDAAVYGADMKWPLVRSLRLFRCEALRWTPDLSLAFPLVRCFESPDHLEWVDCVDNHQFFSRLVSLRGPLQVLRVAKRAGAKLARVVVSESILIDWDLRLCDYLPPCVRILHLETWGGLTELEFSHKLLWNVVRAMPNLEYLRLEIPSGKFCDVYLTSMVSLM